MGIEMRTEIPKRNAEKIADFSQGEIFYYPYSRENWMLMSVVWHNPGLTVTCEVIAEGQNHYGAGRTIRMDPYRLVYRCNEMEVLAWASK